jgi:hypothetical protein
MIIGDSIGEAAVFNVINGVNKKFAETFSRSLF